MSICCFRAALTMLLAFLHARVAREPMKPCRILHIISSADRAGGGPIEGIIQLNRALEGLGFETEIVTTDEPDAPWLAGFPVHVFALGGARLGYRYSPRLEPLAAGECAALRLPDC